MPKKTVEQLVEMDAKESIISVLNEIVERLETIETVLVDIKTNQESGGGGLL